MGKQKNSKFEPKSKNIYKYNKSPINREQTFTRRNVYGHNEFTRSAYNAYSPYRRNHNQVYGTYSRSSNNKRPSNVRHYRKKPLRKLPSRPTSPALGSEEYMVRKIKQTSAIIMEQLLNPDKHDAITSQDHENENGRVECNKSMEQNPTFVKSNLSVNNANKSKKISSYNIEEIHKKIMNHITKLNDGKKKNLINSNTSGYDVAIQQIQKQKRLEISRALRDMCSQSQQTQESNDLINSIIPDIGIKIEDLSPELIEELRNNLDFDLDCLGSIDDAFGITWNDQNDFAIGSSPYESCNRSSIKTCEHIEKIDSYSNGSCSTSGIDAEESKNISRNNCNDSEITREKEVFPQLDIAHEELLTSLDTNNSINDSKLEYIHGNNLNASKPNVVEIKKEIFDYPEPDKLPEISDNLQTHVDKVEVTATSINKTEHQNGDIVTNVAEIKKEVFDYPETDTLPEISDNLLTDDDKLEVTATNINRTEHENGDIVTNVVAEIKKDIPYLETAKLLESCDNLLTSISNNVNMKDTSIIKTVNETDKILSETCQYKDESVPESILRCSIGTQTEEEVDSCTADSYFNSFMKEYFKEAPVSTADAIRKMLEIDDYSSKLTQCRQALFSNFNKPSTDSQITAKRLHDAALHSATDLDIKESTKKKTKIRKRKRYYLADSDIAACDVGTKNGGRRWRTSLKKRKFVSSSLRGISEIATQDESTKNVEISNGDLQDKKEECPGENVVSVEIVQKKMPQNLLKIADVHEKILVIKVMEDKLVAAAESGKIFFCSLDDGHFTKVLKVINVPVTSLLFLRTEQGDAQLYVGSYETYLQVYNFHNQCLLKTMHIQDSVQCLEPKWGYIFIGCIRGTLLRYSIKKQVMEYEDNFTGNSILVLKATQEGARKILIIGSRNSPVCIRDAMTGLFMRTLYERNVMSPTVYSLVMEKSLVYCGTANHDIMIFNFYDGKLIHTFKTDSKGIGCMKIMNDLLFASCHNGNIYVYNTKTNVFVGSIAGPGGVILSMEVMENQIIVGTMSFKFKSIPIPAHIKSS